MVLCVVIAIAIIDCLINFVMFLD